jgi:phosphoglycolate phosphatase/putative hydrolase of the HAD superfamily
VIISTVILDLDGTLYDATKLRSRMRVEIALALLVNPSRFSEIRLLARFRECKEHFADTGARLRGHDEEIRQAAPALSVSPERLAPIVREWIHTRPLKHLPTCAREGVHDFFATMRTRGIKLAIYSDYPTEAKLAALALEADLSLCSLDTADARMKPFPAGLIECCEHLGSRPEHTLFIGDRVERDLACAQAAHIPCWLIGKAKSKDARTFVNFIALKAALEPYLDAAGEAS